MIINGRKLAQELIAQIQEERKKIPFQVRLAIVIVGNNPASLSFIKQKQKVATQLNIDCRVYQLPLNLDTKELRKRVSQISKVTNNRGVVVQLPLPQHIRTQVVLNAILPHKDPDVLCERNLGKFYTGRLKILPPVIAAIKFILNRHQINPEGKRVLVIGRGRLVGQPAALWFIHQGAEVTVVNSKIKNLSEFTRSADIIVSGAGVPGLITKDMIRKGTIIFDCGIVSVNGKLSGDCDTNNLKNTASLITPVPGGIGPLTVVFLFKNLLTLITER